MGTRSGISTGTSIGSGPGKGSGSQQGGSAGGVADTWELGLGGLEQPHPENSPGGCWLRLGGPGTPWGLPGHGQPGTGGRSLPPGEPLFHGEQETSGSFVGAAGGRSRLNGRLSGQTPLPRALRSLCPPGPAREGARCPRAGGEQWPGGGRDCSFVHGAEKRLSPLGSCRGRTAAPVPARGTARCGDSLTPQHRPRPCEPLAATRGSAAGTSPV